MEQKKLSYKELQKHYEEVVNYWSEQNEKINYLMKKNDLQNN